MIILVSSGDSLSGGAGTYVDALVTAFPSVRLASCDESLGDFHLPKFHKSPSFIAFFKLIKLVRKNSVRHIICQSSGGLLISIILRVVFPSIRITNVYHGLASGYHGRYLRILEIISAFFCTNIIVTNKRDGFRLYNKSKQIFIPNFVQNNDTYCSPKFDGPLVSVTRWSKQKNNELLADFLKISDPCLHLYTNISYHETFIELFHSKRQKCFYSVDKQQIYDGKGAFILSTFSEGFPLSILEAASAGLPIIVSEIDILIDLLGDKVQYFSSPNELANIVANLRSDENIFSKWSDRSRALASYYSWDAWLENWKRILESEGAVL